MRADTKTLRVDRAERLGSLGGRCCLSESISARVLQHSAGKEQKRVKKRGQACLQWVKKTLLKDMQGVAVKDPCTRAIFCFLQMP